MTLAPVKRVLTIAGSDSGGGAGIQADLKTFHAFGCYGMSVITAVTAQNTMGVQGITEIPADFVAQQIDSVASDIGVDAAKVGMLANIDIVRKVAEKLKISNIAHLVVDPVMVAKSGDPLLRKDARKALLAEMIPLAEVVTPNIPEAEILAGMTIDSIDAMKQAAERILMKGARNVLVKGGHRKEDATDILFDGDDFTVFYSERVSTKNTHGTGCTYSAAIAANLALGKTVPEAIQNSKTYITLAIRESLSLGSGIGPLNHLVKTR